jgi:hypothetical protein
MKCPNCGFEGEDARTECVRCGIIFRKYLKSRENPETKSEPKKEDHYRLSSGDVIKDILFSTDTDTNRLFFTGRALTFVFLFIWGCKMIVSPLGAGYASSSFMHYVNLPFHEAGHIFFRPFGQWMTSFGGTIGQLLMPVVCVTVFLLKRNPFGASVCLWWLGENFMDITPYINDARSLSLPLLGGNTGADSPYGFHDWEFILNEIGLIRYDHAIARLSFGLGTALMLAAFAWGGYLIFKEYKSG